MRYTPEQLERQAEYGRERLREEIKEIINYFKETIEVFGCEEMCANEVKRRRNGLRVNTLLNDYLDENDELEEWFGLDTSEYDKMICKAMIEIKFPIKIFNPELWAEIEARQEQEAVQAGR